MWKEYIKCELQVKKSNSEEVSFFDASANSASRATAIIGVPDRGAGRAVAPLGFGKLVKFGRWDGKFGHSGD